MKNGIGRFSVIWLQFVYIILYIPIIVVILMSFNVSPYGIFPIHFTLKWYKLLFTESNLFSATWLSLKFSFWVAIAAAIIGTLTAIGMRSMNKKAVDIFSAVLRLTIIFPWIVLSTGMLLFFNAVGIGRSYFSMFLGNLVVVLPYVTMPVFSRLIGDVTSAESAARTLGAGSFRILWSIIIPEISSAIFAGWLLAFIVCFNNFVIQYYLAPFGVRTLPIEIYNLVRIGCKPDMNALTTIIIFFAVIIVFVIYKFGFSIDILSVKERQKESENSFSNRHAKSF
jgi:spermidine/putrescine transport system permease protein